MCENCDRRNDYVRLHADAVVDLGRNEQRVDALLAHVGLDPTNVKATAAALVKMLGEKLEVTDDVTLCAMAGLYIHGAAAGAAWFAEFGHVKPEEQDRWGW